MKVNRNELLNVAGGLASYRTDIITDDLWKKLRSNFNGTSVAEAVLTLHTEFLMWYRIQV